MSRFSVIFKKSDGLCFNGLCYNTEHTPPAEAVPSDCTLVFFDENTEGYELLYALFVEDTIQVGDTYDAPLRGSVKYNFTTNKFEFIEREPFDIIVAVREYRNTLIAQTDLIMQVPDLPASVKDEVKAYRQALRDITKNANPSWTTVVEFPWPELPAALR